MITKQVLLKYCDSHGNEINPNGSVDSIAGICDESKRIFGLMPHPERACEKILGTDDGMKMLKRASLVKRTLFIAPTRAKIYLPQTLMKSAFFDMMNEAREDKFVN